MASCVLKHGKFLRVNYNWTSFQAFDAPDTAGSIQLDPVIPHRFATDRVETRHDIATHVMPTLFALSSSLVWDCKTSCTRAASGGTRDKHTTHLLLDGP